ncbi:hypothetical protein L210DRAFT_3499217 [Boletus edulis BED1]|uniref:Uncharacterized protein n=1 Tax=Boletus edulis BED1 TaxID=1328754 RepID=A0AAD4C897_BOLED|nr:hypothetical protein L210DRAFT_3499217 [Boletus edulis BED1]
MGQMAQPSDCWRRMSECWLEKKEQMKFKIEELRSLTYNEMANLPTIPDSALETAPVPMPFHHIALHYSLFQLNFLMLCNKDCLYVVPHWWTVSDPPCSEGITAVGRAAAFPAQIEDVVKVMMVHFDLGTVGTSNCFVVSISLWYKWYASNLYNDLVAVFKDIFMWIEGVVDGDLKELTKTR